MILELEELVTILSGSTPGASTTSSAPSLRIWTPTEALFTRTESRRRADDGPIILRYNERQEIVAIDFPAREILTNDAHELKTEGWIVYSWSGLVERLDGLEDDGVPPRQALAIRLGSLPGKSIATREWDCLDEFSVIVDLDNAGRFLCIEFA